MSLFSPPKAPDPATINQQGQQLAQTQQTANVAGQAGSMVNQVNNKGSLQYVQTGTGPNGVPTYTAIDQLSPGEQSVYNSNLGTRQTASADAGSALQNANYGSKDPTSWIGNATSGVTSDIVNRNAAFLQPSQQQARDHLDTQLRNQGLLPGQPAYDNAVRDLDTNQGMVLSKTIADTEPQAFQQAQSLYNQPLATASALAGLGTPGDPNPSFVNAPGLQPTNVIGATNTEGTLANQQYQAQMQQYSNMMSGLFAIPSALLGKGGLAGLGGAGGGGGGLESLASLALL